MNYSQLQQLETLIDALDRDLRLQEKWRELATIGFMREIISEQYIRTIPAERQANSTIIRLMGEL